MNTPITSKNLADTRVVAETFLQSLIPQSTATVLTLSGDLGTGKTTFTKELGNLLGIPKNEITSPTFVIMNFYKLQANTYKLSFTHLIHIDAYRLEKEDELIHLGWRDIVSNPENLIVIEWPEMVKGLIPSNARKINLNHIDAETREILLQ